MQRVMSAFMLLALLYAATGSAQQRDAADTDWRFTGAPLFFAGTFYYPSGPTVFFDSAVMVQSGTYEGVPLYVNATLEPYSRVLVPVGGRLMRPYVPRRAGEPPAGEPRAGEPRVGEPVGTVGSGLLPAPVGRETDVLEAAEQWRLPTPPVGVISPAVMANAISIDAGESSSRVEVDNASPYETVPGVAPIRRSSGSMGVWIEFAGKKWVASGGDTAPQNRRELRTIGMYYGFPVYQDRLHQNRILIPSVIDGPLAEYTLKESRSLTTGN